MNWYALVKGQLVCIGNCGDWTAAYEIACDAIGETEWDWLASAEDVSQWLKVFSKNESRQSANILRNASKVWGVKG